MLELKVLILELLAVDGLATGTIAGSEVTTLNHELLYDAMEAGALVVEGLAGLPNTLLTGAESAEVLGGLRHNIAIQLQHDTTSRTLTDADVEEDAAACCRLGLVGSHFRIGGFEMLLESYAGNSLVQAVEEAQQIRLMRTETERSSSVRTD